MYHSTVGLRVIKKKKRERVGRDSETNMILKRVLWTEAGCILLGKVLVRF